MMFFKKIILLVTAATVFGCTAGVNFKKMEESQLLVGKTTKTEVLSAMGKPNGVGKNTFNGIELEVISYTYAKAGSGAVLPGVTPARSQGLLFKDGVLVGKEYNSSFAEDSTLFDVEKAKTVTKGQTKEAVISLMGAARGEYLYPIVDDQNGFALVYLFTQAKGFKFKSDLLVVEFDQTGTVTKTKLSSSGQL